MASTDNTNEWLTELCGMLHKSARLDVRLTASSNVLMLTGSDEGRLFFRQNKQLLEAIFSNIEDAHPLVQKDAMLSLVNLSTDATFVTIALASYDILPTIVKCITVAKSKHADKACSILSNMTRNSIHAQKVFNILENELPLLLGIYTKIKYNTEKQTLDYLGQFFANITQAASGRLYFLDKEKLNLQKMILFLTHESITRRGAAAILIKNICFVSDDNSWLLGPSVDILPALLLPLAGGSAIANLDMDDMERLPDDLQFLDESKEREPDSDIRIMLVEAIHLLCNKTEDRKFIRDKNTYVILRELHKVEMEAAEESANNRAIQQLIDLLIGDDPTADDLRAFEVPEAMEEKLVQRDNEELEAIEKFKKGDMTEE